MSIPTSIFCLKLPLFMTVVEEFDWSKDPLLVACEGTLSQCSILRFLFFNGSNIYFVDSAILTRINHNFSHKCITQSGCVNMCFRVLHSLKERLFTDICASSATKIKIYLDYLYVPKQKKQFMRFLHMKIYNQMPKLGIYL